MIVTLIPSLRPYDQELLRSWYGVAVYIIKRIYIQGLLRALWNCVISGHLKGMDRQSQMSVMHKYYTVRTKS